VGGGKAVMVATLPVVDGEAGTVVATDAVRVDLVGAA
jgi:hypothetical protein